MVTTTGEQSSGQQGDTLDQARQAAGQVADTAQEKTGQLLTEVKNQASSRLSPQVTQAADQLTGLSDAFQGVGHQLRHQDQAMLADYTDKAAEQVRHASDYLRGKDVDQLVADAETFARRRPAVFLGAALGLGLLTARFLRSSGQGSAQASGGAGTPHPQLALPSASGSTSTRGMSAAGGPLHGMGGAYSPPPSTGPVEATPTGYPPAGVGTTGPSSSPSSPLLTPPPGSSPLGGTSFPGGSPSGW